LLGDFSDIFNLQALIVFNNIKKLPLTELCHQNELAWGLKRIQQQNYVLMLELFQNLYLFSHGLDVFLLFAFFLD